MYHARESNDNKGYKAIFFSCHNLTLFVMLQVSPFSGALNFPEKISAGAPLRAITKIQLFHTGHLGLLRHTINTSD